MKLHPGKQALWDTNIITSIFDGSSYGKDFPGVVVDIGAHIGGFTTLAAQTASTVFAFEANARNFALLRENTRGLANVQIFHRAVGSSGTQTLYIPEVENTGTYSLYRPAERSEQVQGITFQEIVQMTGPVDFLKCDCEGAEYDIFSDAELLGNIKRAIIEMHYIDEWADKYNAFLKRMAEGGFTIDIRPSFAKSATMLWLTR